MNTSTAHHVERFGTRVRAVRQFRGWRQDELADKAGVSRTTVVRIEKGEDAATRLSRIIDICEALDVSLQEMVGDQPLTLEI